LKKNNENKLEEKIKFKVLEDRVSEILKGAIKPTKVKRKPK